MSGDSGGRLRTIGRSEAEAQTLADLYGLDLTERYGVSHSSFWAESLTFRIGGLLALRAEFVRRERCDEGAALHIGVQGLVSVG